MTTDLRDKTVEELLDEEWGESPMAVRDEFARRLAEAEQQIAEQDAMLTQCVLIGRNILLALTPDLPKDKRPTFEEFSNSIQSLPASAKANAEVLRQADRLLEWDQKYPKGTIWNYGEHTRCANELTEIIEAVRAAKEIK